MFMIMGNKIELRSKERLSNEKTFYYLYTFC